MGKGLNFLYGIIIGSAIGGATTLLTSPTSGKELRKQLQTNSQHLIETLQKLKSEGLDLSNTITSSSKQSITAISEFKNDLVHSFDQWTESTKENKKSIQKELSEIEILLSDLEKSVRKS
ncbi:YtxH domain-containing protein [Bacillus luteolus]|uniref:YtxH domain-containing protein n=1 Tax=Litchfieldia luteola TaxID=682179 RepID=A0ABR9QE68_9BACI|nr:YtxH domain-containing protein [Cytobacillus luteolus]MBE4906748.1 YtxH domain-containing protein [Cytobacillus luteolus]MBP1940601.1 gas vesicle protein [Cytobacillus luteolus]